MASWASWTIATTLLVTGLAGCVEPAPDASRDCEGWSRYWCGEREPPTCACDGCGCATPHPAPWQPEPACPATATFSPPMSLTCATPHHPPPLLDALVPRRLTAACDGCADVAIASDGARVFVATERALLVAEGETARELPLPEPLRAPHVSVDAAGRAWIAGLVLDAHPPAAVLLAYDGGATLARVGTLGALDAPALLLAERAYVVPMRGGALLLLDTGSAAWSVEHDGHAFGTPQALTPAGGDARVGAPVADGRGRVLVPFSFTPRDPLAPATGLLLPALAPTALYYATMGPREGAWTTRGGVPAPQGVAEPPALERGPRGATALLWVDASGALQRVETWDDGGSWGAPEPWSDLAAHAAGAPAALRPDQRATAAWWEARDGGASLVVARAEGGAAPAARLEVAWLPEPRASAALSLVEGSRAVVAWATQAGEVWLGVEGGALPAPGCDDAAHCLPRVHAW